MRSSSILLSQPKFDLTLKRLCYQLIENQEDLQDTVIIGLQPRGVLLANRIHSLLTEITGTNIPCGALDVTFFRDDFRRRDNPVKANKTQIEFIIEDKNVILVDDVLYTGRTIRAGLDAMLAFGRPRKVELMVLVDRRYARHLPIEPDYIGMNVDTISAENVRVTWKETDGKDEVVLVKPEV